ncbi:MAG: RNA methyltransferase [Ignavibacteria bacterium]|nr:RNA methyltransferase [Ignavibacteria bacterium]
MHKYSFKYYEKLKQKKYRRLENKFLIEGENLLSECLSSGKYAGSVEALFYRKGYNNNHLIQKAEAANPDLRAEELEENVFSKLSDTVNSQGIIACIGNAEVKDQADLINEKTIVALENVSDPGNLGTIIRTCYWFGISNVILNNTSGEFQNPKVLRSSQGAVFYTDIIIVNDFKNFLREFESKGFNILLLDVKAEKFISDPEFVSAEKNILVFGNESNGISEDVLTEPSFQKVKIKGYSDCESLNVAVSAGIVINQIICKSN